MTRYSVLRGRQNQIRRSVRAIAEGQPTAALVSERQADGRWLQSCVMAERQLGLM